MWLAPETPGLLCYDNLGLEKAQYSLVERQGDEGTTLKKGVSSSSCRRSCKDTLCYKTDLGGLVSVLDRLSRYLKDISSEKDYTLTSPSS